MCAVLIVMPVSTIDFLELTLGKGKVALGNVPMNARSESLQLQSLSRWDQSVKSVHPLPAPVDPCSSSKLMRTHG